jgi:hypothetical protein
VKIELLVTGTPVDVKDPGPPRPGRTFWFSDNLVLRRVDPQVTGAQVLEPGNGLPQNPQDRHAGTHSGSITVLRVAPATDEYVLGGGELFAYEGTYVLSAVAVAGQLVLRDGQVTARGVILLRNGQAPFGKRFAITGGIGAYATARGQGQQIDQPDNLRILEIVM